MLIRVSGGSGGFGLYMVFGVKSGRKKTRTELDRRVVLDGDLDLFESIINAMPGEGERYLHITASFKEDNISAETLRDIFNDIKMLVMSAYRYDEYCIYAEAHAPKIKSYINESSGELVERKPHIHIAIPELNLLTGRKTNPLGLVDNQVVFLESIQEYINHKYGLASPKDNRRVKFTDESEIISRYKGDSFKYAGRELKQRILDSILNDGIQDCNQFSKLVSSFGAVRVRNKGKPNEYLNVKPGGFAKGVNLKDYVFSPEFIALPAVEKESRLRAKAFEYIESKYPRPSSLEIEARLAEWREIRSRELKYINSGSRRYYGEYRAADRSGKLKILEKLESEFYAKHDAAQTEINNAEQDYNFEIDNSKPDNGDSSAEMVIFIGTGDGRDADNVVEQIRAEHAEAKARAAGDAPDFARIKRALNATRLLASLSRTHGVIPEKYQITKGRDGGDRIRCGSRNLNVGDFITQELHLPWRAAAEILRAEYAAQIDQAPRENRQAIRADLWEAYRQTWPQEAAQKASDWAAQKAREIQRRTEIREQYQGERCTIKGQEITSAERKAALSLAGMRRVAADRALRALVEEERAQLKATYERPRSEKYRDYLRERAEGGDAAALAELRRQRQSATAKDSSVVRFSIEAATQGYELPELPPQVIPLAHSVDQLGNVTYYADAARTHAVLVDTGDKIEFPDAGADRDTVETGLWLALQKFGPRINVTGSAEFKQRVVEAVVRTGLHVELDDPALAADLYRRRAEQQEARELERAQRRPERQAEGAEAQQGKLDRSLNGGLDWVTLSDDWSDRDPPQEREALDLFDLDDQNEWDDDPSPTPSRGRGPRMG